MFLTTLALVAALQAEQCSVIIPHPSGQGVTYQPVAGYSVQNSDLPLRFPPGFDGVQAIVCARPNLVISDNDFRVVVDLGVPMMIGARGVIGSLEISNGRMRFRVIQGELTAAEAEMVQQALDRGQAFVEPTD